MITMNDIKKLRASTGSGVMDAKRALVECKGDMKKATQWITKKGLAKAEKKSDRETSQGIVHSYVHHDGKSGCLVSIKCETDFVAKTKDIKELAQNLALQVVSMKPKNNKDLLSQNFVKDPKITISELIKVTAGKLGENIQLGEFAIIKI